MSKSSTILDLLAAHRHRLPQPRCKSQFPGRQRNNCSRFDSGGLSTKGDRCWDGPLHKWLPVTRWSNESQELQKLPTCLFSERAGVFVILKQQTKFKSCKRNAASQARLEGWRRLQEEAGWTNEIRILGQEVYRGSSPDVGKLYAYPPYQFLYTNHTSKESGNRAKWCKRKRIEILSFLAWQGRFICILARNIMQRQAGNSIKWTHAQGPREPSEVPVGSVLPFREAGLSWGGSIRMIRETGVSFLDSSKSPVVVRERERRGWRLGSGVINSWAVMALPSPGGNLVISLDVRVSIVSFSPKKIFQTIVLKIKPDLKSVNTLVHEFISQTKDIIKLNWVFNK